MTKVAHIDQDIHKRAKVKSAQEGRPLGTVINEALEDGLNRRGSLPVTPTDIRCTVKQCGGNHTINPDDILSSVDSEVE